MVSGKRIVFSLVFVIFLADFSVAEQENRLTCTGNVVDANERPVTGVNVTLYRVDVKTAYLYDPMVIAETITDNEGKYSFTENSREDMYRYVVVRKEGMAPGFATWRVWEGDAKLDIKLTEGNVLAGTVVDEIGKPVPGAKVGISLIKAGRTDRPHHLLGLLAMQLYSTKTDSQGKFQFADVPAGVGVDFIVEKTGRATLGTETLSGYKEPRFFSGQTDIKLVMPLEAKIEGIVVKKDSGVPVGGVDLVVINASKDDPANIKNMLLVSKKDGTFDVGALSEGRYIVQLKQAGDSLANWVAESQMVITEAGETISGVQIELSRGGILEVAVEDAAKKEPLGQASVRFIREVHSRNFICHTDKKGLTRIRLLPGDYRIEDVRSSEFKAQKSRESFTIEEGKTVHLKYELIEQPKITGIVRDESGNPVKDVAIDLFPAAVEEDPVTDADGKFQANYDSGWSGTEIPDMLLVCRNEEHNLAGAFDVNTATRNIDITLKPGLIFAGRIVDPNGKGIPGAEARLSVLGPMWRSTLRKKPTITDEKGNYKFRAVPAGCKYRLDSKADGYGEAHYEEIDTTGASDKRIDMADIVLYEANLSVSGVVVDVNGVPIAYAEAECSSSIHPYRKTRTDSDGKFTLDKVCQGRIVVRAESAGDIKLSGAVETEGGARGVKIVVTEKKTTTRYIPLTPPSLVDKSLPDIKELNVKVSEDSIENKMVFVCFFDMNQRPSRRCISQLNEQIEQIKEKGVAVIGIQAANVDDKTLNEWIKSSGVSFPVGTIQNDEEQTRFKWGVKSLPWLILTDKKHTVIAEGFGVSELDDKIK